MSTAATDQYFAPVRRVRVTVISASYPPAFLMGGPVRSLAALTEQLSDEFDFSVITSAFDDPAAGRMPGIQPDHWTQTAHARVWHFGARRPSPWNLNRLIGHSNPDVVYLNSLFDARFSIFPLMASRLLHPRRRVLLAPRGELSPGALQIRARKKRLYLLAFRGMRLHKFVTWHASTGMEAADILHVMGPFKPNSDVRPRRLRTGRTFKARPMRIEVAQDLCPVHAAPENARPMGGYGSMVFLSRIVPIKNLHTLLDAITLVSGDVTLTVAGPAEDAKYWERCQRMITFLPAEKKVEYVGSIPGDGVVSFLAGFDLFVLPTLGENFGHVVLEALTAGVPVIVGIDTPWSVIEETGAGWTCDPRDPYALARRIEEFRALSSRARIAMTESARRLAESIINDPEAREANRRLFRRMVEGLPK